MKNRHFKSILGSTVIEVLIATTIVAFALTGLAALMTNNVKNSAEADYREAAAGIAQDAMERIRQGKTTTAWTTFRGSPYVTAPECNITDTSSINFKKKYNTTFYVRCVATTPVPANDITITVTVCWPGNCGTADKSTAAVQRFYNN